eukprot:scaffold489_cov309-Pavlova_lutheri.AAC.17
MLHRVQISKWKRPRESPQGRSPSHKLSISLSDSSRSKTLFTRDVRGATSDALGSEFHNPFTTDRFVWGSSQGRAFRLGPMPQGLRKDASGVSRSSTVVVRGGGHGRFRELRGMRASMRQIYRWSPTAQEGSHTLQWHEKKDGLEVSREKQSRIRQASRVFTHLGWPAFLDEPCLSVSSAG